MDLAQDTVTTTNSVRNCFGIYVAADARTPAEVVDALLVQYTDTIERGLVVIRAMQRVMREYGAAVGDNNCCGASLRLCNDPNCDFESLQVSEDAVQFNLLLLHKAEESQWAQWVRIPVRLDASGHLRTRER